MPRKYDYHPLGIPAPYNHSNIDSEEVLYYVNGNFMSRQRHRRGLVHPPPARHPARAAPGAAEASLGKEETDELAVMVDTFRPLKMTAWAREYDDPDYPMSWLDQPTTQSEADAAR